MRGSRGGAGICITISPILLEMKKLAFFIFVHFHSYTSNRINPQNNNQITSIQVCVMGFFLLKVGPPLEKISGSAPEFTSFKVQKIIYKCIPDMYFWPCLTPTTEKRRIKSCIHAWKSR